MVPTRRRSTSAPFVAALLLASTIIACGAPDSGTEDAANVEQAATLSPTTSPLADAVDTRCASAFTAADRTAIETAMRATDLAPADLVAHAQNRLGFGDRLARTAVPADAPATLASQIDASLRAGGSIPASARTAMTAALPTLARPSGDVHAQFRKLYTDRDAARAAGNATLAASLDTQIVAMRDGILDELAGKQIMAAALSGDIGLGEHLTSFWLNHFNVEGRLISIWAPAYEWTIRTNVCGTFSGMLKEVAHTPAMLRYLDNYMSVAPGSTHWTGATSINENYAREVMELHTLGTGPRTPTNTTSPYTQADVVEVARTLTGWSYTYATDQRSTLFKFFPEYHAAGTKTVMGVAYAQGEVGGNALLANLANHARTKQFVCGKLAQHFFASAPPAAVVNACVAQWGNGGVLPRMIVAILSRSEVWKSANFGNKVKNPFELVVSSHRLSGDTGNTLTAGRVKSATLASRRMGLWLWRVVDPTGYTNQHLDWVDASYLDEQQRYVYGQSDPLGLSWTVNGTVLSGNALEQHFVNLANTNGDASALLTAEQQVLPLGAVRFPTLFDRPFLQRAFSQPDTAPGTTPLERPLRTLLGFYASSWQFLLK